MSVPDAVALLWVLVALPVLNGLNTTVLLPAVPEDHRFFVVWGTIVALEWTGFGLCIAAASREGDRERILPRPRRGVATAAVIAAFAFPGLALLRMAAGWTGRYAGMFSASTPGELLFLVGVATPTAAICEEVMYRSFAITRLERVTGATPLAALIAVVAFVAMHGAWVLLAHPGQMLFLGSMGAVFTFLYLVRRDVHLPIAVHWLYDACTMLLFYSPR